MKKRLGANNGSNPLRNPSGCIDKTAHDAIEKADAERERLHSIIDVIYTICELAGFRVEERIVLRDKKTGRIWR